MILGRQKGKFMFRSNLCFVLSFLTVLCLSSLQALAQEGNNIFENEKEFASRQLKTVSLSYVSWTEFVDLDNGTVTDRAFASFYGNALSFEKEISYSPRFGTILEAAFLFGQANAGGSQTVITYQTSYQKWWGFEASARFAYRLSSQIAMSVGPLVLARQISWPNQTPGVDMKSGAPINFGALADLRMRLNRNWELRQTIGTLTFKASTLWSLGIGYKF